MAHWGGFEDEWRFRPQPRAGVPVPARELRARAEALRAAPLFADLPRHHLRSIAKVTRVSTYAAGATLVKEGQPGSEFFVILEGRASVVRGTRTLGRLKAGDFFGEISLLDGGPRTASVIARTNVVCLELAGKDFNAILSREPLLGARISRHLAGRLRERERAPAG